ncbi:hypothetical protein BC830DRAFT_1107189 [Chytriomyces sp. MP71]|nr:hypothetical protein BC830DRAFT_1107189 [Chytriomyces sp. MP71]
MSSDNEADLPPPVPESERHPNILYDRHGQPLDGKLTKDKTIIYVAIGVFFILLCSWIAQWTAFALPHWRGDKYHSGGLFQVCGTQDLAFDPNVDALVPNKTAGAIREYRCQSIQEYAEDLTLWTCNAAYFVPFTKKNATTRRPPTTTEGLPTAVPTLGRRGMREKQVENGDNTFNATDNDFCAASKLFAEQIVVSRWFEAATTVMDMLFGTTTIGFMLFPDPSPKKSMRNGLFALIGIFLVQSPCMIPISSLTCRLMLRPHGSASQIFSFKTDTGIGGILLSLISYTDTFRHGWKIVNFKMADVGMGPIMEYGNSRKKAKIEADSANELRVQRVVDSVMQMGPPGHVTREQVEAVTRANNADINLVVEQVFAKHSLSLLVYGC